MKSFILAAITSLFSFTIIADDFATTRAKIEEAMNSPIRSEKEKKRDANRKPIETLEFFGFRDDMKVVELIPGAGWYTKILAPVLHEKGEYIASMNSNRIRDQILILPGFEKGRAVAEEARYWRKTGSILLSIEIKSLNIKNADMALTFRNYGNFTEPSRKNLNEEVFKILKPGGIYGVVNYSARHMEPRTHSEGHRIDPVRAIKEITSAGFEFIDYSDIHYRPDDDLTQDARKKAVRATAERWTLKFRKPIEKQPEPIPAPKVNQGLNQQ